MTRTARTLVISAAMAGLVAGTMSTTGCKSSTGSSASDNASAKHDCKGMNSCKGTGRRLPGPATWAAKAKTLAKARAAAKWPNHAGQRNLLLLCGGSETTAHVLSRILRIGFISTPDARQSIQWLY